MFKQEQGWETNDYDGGYENWLAYINPEENDETEYSDISFKQDLYLTYLTLRNYLIDYVRTPLNRWWRDFRWIKLGIVYSNEEINFSYAQAVNPKRYGEKPDYIYTYNENGHSSVRRSK